ncbi:MAG: hypothetical protein M0P91_14380 [Sulfuricurvum sp.]|jgi:hypothetical protein|uniref:hypothetical protein n=1 Tax=Sulfuricurvum sp. TaxID=2025608 RepID=UPI0025FF577A|nr:hypothetical protein [Sulfuricurvum sp.]MCK9374365.1 hypothetical protein [Sulfuricurvum sp.]
MEHLFTGYGMIGIGLVLISIFFVFAKVMGFVWKIVFFGAIALGGFVYFRNMIS